jgi:hypothetical protein
LRHKANADSDGRYVIHGLEKGLYKIKVSKAGYDADEQFNNRWSGQMALNPKINILEAVSDAPGEIEILPNACQIRDLSMWPSGKIQGTLRKADGSPAAGIPVQSFRFDRSGERESTPFRTGVSGPDGKYSIEPLPEGRYVVGINASTHQDESPHPPIEYDRGAPMALGESELVVGVDFDVPAPRIPAQIRVHVYGPDGRPYRGASARLANPSGVQRWYSQDKSDNNGKIEVPGYVGERYTVIAFDYVDGRELVGNADVDLTGKQVQVTVVLRYVDQGRK